MEFFIIIAILVTVEIYKSLCITLLIYTKLFNTYRLKILYRCYIGWLGLLYIIIVLYIKTLFFKPIDYSNIKQRGCKR